MTLPLDDVTGSQLPRLESAPKSVRSAGEDAAELAALCGLELDPWQRHVLDVSLGEKRDGKWSAFEVGLLVPRQNGKGAVLEARELAGLFLFDDERLILHSAHELKTAIEAFLRIRDLISGTPDLMEKFEPKFYQSNEKTAIELNNGKRLRFMARSSGSGRGFSGDVIILDEAYNLPFETLAAILPTMSAKSITGNPQIWYTSSAGMETSEVLAGIRQRGVKGDKALAFFDWSAPADADIDDEAAWAQANPGLGIRISSEFVTKERAAMGDSPQGREMFARERLGIWFDPGEGTVIDSATWQGQVDEDSEPVGPVAFAVDVSPDRRVACIAAAGFREDGDVHVELVERFEDGTGRVLDALNERLVSLSKHKYLTVVVDGSGPAASLIPDLQQARVKVFKSGSQDMKQACGGFFDRVVQGHLWHLGDEFLNLAVAAGTKRVLGDAWAWDRKSPASDITPLVAVTLAAHGLMVKRKRTDQTSKVVIL